MMDSGSVLKEKPAGFAERLWDVRGRGTITVETEKAVKDIPALDMLCL